MAQQASRIVPMLPFSFTGLLSPAWGGV